MWADGRTIFDLVNMGRCSEAALERLQRGQEITRMIGDNLEFDGTANALPPMSDMMATTWDHRFQDVHETSRASLNFDDFPPTLPSISETMSSTWIRRFSTGHESYRVV